MFFSREVRLIRRILVVEDEPLTAFDNEYVLKQAGYDVVATVDRVADAEAVLEEGGAVDLIITDTSLRGRRTGVDLARHVQPLGIPVLFASASIPHEAGEMSVVLGCLAKPFDSRDDLVDAIAACERLLGGKAPGRLPQGMMLFAVG